jgi:hypothetical protein
MSQSGLTERSGSIDFSASSKARAAWRNLNSITKRVPLDAAAGVLARMADFEQSERHFPMLGEVRGFSAGSKHSIEAFDVAADGALSNRRFFCNTVHGYPDGLLVGPRGWVWTSAAEGFTSGRRSARNWASFQFPVVVSNLTGVATGAGCSSRRPRASWQSTSPLESGAHGSSWCR